MYPDGGGCSARCLNSSMRAAWAKDEHDLAAKLSGLYPYDWKSRITLLPNQHGKQEEHTGNTHHLTHTHTTIIQVTKMTVSYHNNIIQQTTFMHLTN